MKWLLALVVLGGVAHAQTPNNQLSYAAMMKAPIGSWAEYQMSKEGEDETIKIRYTLVERNAKRVALELDSATPMGRMLMRMEFRPDGAPGASRWKLEHARMKLGEQPIREMPIPTGDAASATTFGKDDSFGEKVGHEPVKTKGGTFTADHFKRNQGQWVTEVWMDEKILPIGLVRLKDGQGALVELVGSGHDGKSVFPK